MLDHDATVPGVGDDLDVVGIGNALVDVLVTADPALIAACGLTKGSMTLMDSRSADAIAARVGPGQERSGGSAANTVAGLASLGATTGFVGVVAEDDLGRSFEDDLRAMGVVVAVARRPAGSGRTGRSLILVTPDADRTMCTSLGVAGQMGPDDLDAGLLQRARMTYLEGYLFDEPAAKDAFRQAIKIAHDAGREVAMSLSDPFCVQRHRHDFAELVAGQVDLLFANEAEICELAGTGGVEAACGLLRRPGLTITVTLGARGALVSHGSAPLTRVRAAEVHHVVDTTGAGDLYAAGYLYGRARGLDAALCAQLGVATAGEIIAHIGARPVADLAALVRPLLG